MLKKRRIERFNSTANSRVIRALSIRLQKNESSKRVSPALSQANHQGLQHDDSGTWLNIEEDLVGAGVDAILVGLGHDLIKRFIDNIWAGEDISGDSSSAYPEELEADGPVDYSDGQNEDIWGSEDDGDRAPDSKEKINDLQEVESEPPAAKTHAAGDIDPSIIDFHNVDIGWDSEYQILWDQVVNNTEQIKSRRVFAYKKI